MNGLDSDRLPVVPPKGRQAQRLIVNTDPVISPLEGVQNGFSLFEVLTSLVVLTIITGLAAVSLGPYWQKHQLKQTTGEVIEQIQVCRTKAIVEQKTYQIKISGQTLSRRFMSGANWSSWESNRISGPAHLSMDGTSSFYSKGFASPKTITVIHDEYQQKIVININGRARVSEVY